MTVAKPEYHRGDNAQRQHHRDIYSHHGSHKHHYIWQYHHRVGVIADRYLGRTEAHHHIHKQCDDGGGDTYPQVGLELVGHLAPLRTCGGNRCVGDKRQVVTEKRTAEHYGHIEWQTCPARIGHLHGKRRKGHDGADRCADGKRDKARGHKECGDYELRRKETECEIDSGVNGSYLLGQSSKGSGKDKYPYHIKYVGMAGRAREGLDALHQCAAATIDDDTPHRGHKKGH